MIDRYTLEKMNNVWNIEAKFNYYLQVELAVCEAYHKLGKISAVDLQMIKSRARFDVNRISEIEREVGHDVIAFLTNVNESLGDLSRHMHVGLTSSDVIDTAMALQIQVAGAIINADFKKAVETLKTLALKHKNTVCIGRSHGVHAEVTTFGIKLLNWVDILERQQKNFEYMLEEVRVGQISGPVGTYSNVSPEVEKITCEILGLKSAKISTQIIARDYHAGIIQELSLTASVIEQFATEIRSLQRTEILEAEEGFGANQKGSSAMPHKKNPVLCENLCGLARVVRANSLAALENIPLWHERDISHSSCERIIFPDSFILVDFMLNRFNLVMENLVVHEKNMLKNINLFGGIVFSQKVLLKLVEKGLLREVAYKIVQKAALDAFEGGGNFKQNLENDENVKKYLSEKEIEDCFSTEDYLKNVDTIFARFTNL